MCLVAQIATLVLGIIALVKGEVKLTGNNVIRGPRARVIGVLLLLPLTLALIGGFILGFVIGMRGQQVNLKDLEVPTMVINVSTFAVPMGIALLLSFLPGGQSDRRRRRDEDWDHEDDDRRDGRERRGRDRWEDDEPAGEAGHTADRPAPARSTEPPPPVERAPEGPTAVSCPSCTKQLAIPAGSVGKSVRCPMCQQVFVAQAAPKPARIECTQCRKELQVPKSALGKSVKCPACQQVFVAQARQEAIQVAAPRPSGPPLLPEITSPRAGRDFPAHRRRSAADRDRPRSSATPWILAAIFGGLFIVALLVVGGFLLFRSGAAVHEHGKKDIAIIRKFEDDKKDWKDEKKDWKDEKKDDKRPRFGDELAQKIVLAKGSFETRSRLDATDPLDRGSVDAAAKIYLIALEAEQALLVEIRKGDGFITPRIRIENFEGQTVSKAPPPNVLEPNWLLFIAPKTATYRFVVSHAVGFGQPEIPFTLSVRQVDDGDPLPTFQRGPQLEAAAVRQSILLKRKIDSYLAAAIAPDSKTAYVAYPKGKLERFACPGFEVEKTYRLPKQCYQLVLDRRGKLYAMVQRAEKANTPLPWMELGPADLHIYDIKAAKEETLTPAKVLPLDGIVMHMMVSPDDGWLYFLDRHRGSVGRVDLEKGRIDGQTSKIETGTNALCMTPDGAALYTCSSGNVVQRLNPRTLAVERTIKIDKGKPNGIQATDKGHVFLNSGEGQWTNIWFLNAARDHGDGIANVLPWAPLYQTNSIRLAPDQKRLYAACFQLSPSNITSFTISARPGLIPSERSGEISLDGVNALGRMEISPDGEFLFCDRGLILSLGR